MAVPACVWLWPLAHCFLDETFVQETMHRGPGLYIGRNGHFTGKEGAVS
jgi:hypothetical protein